MVSKRIVVGGLVMIFVLMMFTESCMAQSNCMNVIISMSSCLNYVTGSSKTPSPSCCSSLANVVQTQPRCLCTVLNGGGTQLGVNINNTLALQLPGACNVKTPPASRCNETSPGPADGSADGTSDSPTTPAITGSKATPGTATPSSGNVMKKNMNLQVGFIVMLLVAHVSKLISSF